MPTGPKSEKRPANRKDPAAKALGKKGGHARAASMTSERRTEVAKNAAEARWRKNTAS